SEAEIYINDKYYGKTPRDIEGLDAGIDMALRLEREGYQNYFSILHLEPNQTKIIQPILKRADEAQGSLSVTSIPPGALVFIGGVGRGVHASTVVKIEKVGADHYLLLRLKGYEDYTSRFRVGGGGQKSIKA